MPPPIDVERLLAQTGWVRRLALSLARDEASADDLVQDTFVAALRRPPPDVARDASLRAWISHVLRNLAFRRKRDDYRRELRERQRGVGGRTDEEARARELEELRTELFEHVVELPDASRQVVLLRYFEEYDSAEIARRLGVPDSTVRNRLRRALVELRERLERRHGADWRNLCLFALPNPGVKIAAGAGALAAGGGLWLGLGGLAVVGLLVLLVWTSNERAGTSGDALAVPHARSAALGAEAPNPERADAANLRSVAEPAEQKVSVSTVPPPGPPLVRGTVLDEDGEPASEFVMTWIDELGNTRVPVHQVGGYSLENAHSGRWMVSITGVGWRSAQTDVVLDDAPGEQCVDFRVRATHIVAVRLVDPAGRSLVRPVEGGRLPWQNTLTPFASTRELPDVLPNFVLQDLRGSGRSSRFWGLHERSMIRRDGDLIEGCLGYLELHDDPPLHVALLDGNVVIARRTLLGNAQELDFMLDEQELAAKHQSLQAGLRARVVLPSGAPAVNCGVKAYGPPTLPVLGPDGSAEWTDLPPGPCQVTFTCPGYTRLELECDLTAGQVHDLGDIRLAPERWLFVRFLLPDDASDLVRFSVARPSEGVPWRTVTSESTGRHRAFAGQRARIPWPGTGSYVLRVAGIGNVPSPRNGEVRNDYHGGARPVRFELDDASPDEITVQIVHTQRVVLRPSHESMRGARWLIATDDGTPYLSVATEGRAPIAIELPPGGYSLFAVDEWTGTPGSPLKFVVAGEPLFLDLAR